MVTRARSIRSIPMSSRSAALPVSSRLPKSTARSICWSSPLPRRASLRCSRNAASVRSSPRSFCRPGSRNSEATGSCCRPPFRGPRRRKASVSSVPTQSGSRTPANASSRRSARFSIRSASRRVRSRSCRKAVRSGRRSPPLRTSRGSELAFRKHRQRGRPRVQRLLRLFHPGPAGRGDRWLRRERARRREVP